MVQQLRTLAALAEDQGLSPNTSSVAHYQALVIPAPGDLTSFSGLHGHCIHMFIPTHRHINKKILINERNCQKCRLAKYPASLGTTNVLTKVDVLICLAKMHKTGSILVKTECLFSNADLLFKALQSFHQPWR